MEIATEGHSWYLDAQTRLLPHPTPRCRSRREQRGSCTEIWRLGRGPCRPGSAETGFERTERPLGLKKKNPSCTFPPTPSDRVEKKGRRKQGSQGDLQKLLGNHGGSLDAPRADGAAGAKVGVTAGERLAGVCGF